MACWGKDKGASHQKEPSDTYHEFVWGLGSLPRPRRHGSVGGGLVK